MIQTNYRSHSCGELQAEHIGQKVSLCGWVAKVRDKGSLIWVDLRDKFGITQISIVTDEISPEIVQVVRSLGREFVIQVIGTVVERVSKNDKIATGFIEIIPEKITVLNESKVPPFLIEDDTDGGDDLRLKYRYLDLRRNPVRKNLELRHKLAKEIRNYLDNEAFVEVETPVLIKSTPEGARDFVVPSRMNPGEFYALPQSPQTFKQLLMVAGFDRYYQIVKCFRDEDLRADRQPEFTQIDCEMSFVEQEDILNTFEGMVSHLFQKAKGISLPTFERMTYAHAMKFYGSDKPDIRFGMPFFELKADSEHELAVDFTYENDFPIFKQAELVAGICVSDGAEFTRKQIDELTDFIKRPQTGATGMIWLRVMPDGELKSSVDKFYGKETLLKWATLADAKIGDLLLILAGEAEKTRKALGELRLEIAEKQGLRSKDCFACLWVVDFPLLEYSEEHHRWVAMHHPFTSPKAEDFALLETDPGKVRANAYDMVINGVEIGGGSIRIFDKSLQAKMFSLLGFSDEDAKAQFGFLMDAFSFGAPPHGGIALGFDRLCTLFGGADSIRDFIAFPKNNAGRDTMIESPSPISKEQLLELNLDIRK